MTSISEGSSDSSLRSTFSSPDSDSTMETTSTVNSLPDEYAYESTDSGTHIYYTPNYRIIGFWAAGGRFYVGDEFYGFTIRCETRQLVQNCRCDKQGGVHCRRFRTWIVRPSSYRLPEYHDYPSQASFNLKSCECAKDGVNPSNSTPTTAPRHSSTPSGSPKRGGPSREVSNPRSIKLFHQANTPPDQ